MDESARRERAAAAVARANGCEHQHTYICDNVQPRCTRAPHDWDGAGYDRISMALERNGRAVLERLELAGDETVLDAGCDPAA